MLLARAAPDVKGYVLEQIDLLADRTVHHYGAMPHPAAIEALAQLFRESGSWGMPAQTRAAELLLPYALRHRNAQVSPLIIAAFPIAYAELAKGTSTPNLLSIFLFYDWDRCRTAREALVDAFVESVWPPVDLLVTALNADIVSEVLGYLAHRYRGPQYIAAIKEDIPRLPLEIQARLTSFFER
ncbi:hypothetical protein FRZ61_31810 [Hypericibacter adhaerens]|uniref:Uncharacterized protein n=1 Tax=Hypericibacter adhaerens TaxID=2602016 RepID=A0A5J6N2N7_9PROT|nr:hypothetical protein FRZ61_31810 [Hypericibacter adhaerens]